MLTGGQRQRISIARAIIKRPSLLLLDEATSALDGASELAVQKALDRLLVERSMTTVIVAHRLRTVQRADRIAVLRDGRVAELGSHDELMRIRDGLYRAMVDRAGPSGFLPPDPDPHPSDNAGRPTQPASPGGGSVRKRTNRRSASDASSLSPRGRIDEDIQTTIEQLEFAESARHDEKSEDDVAAMTVMPPHDGVPGRGLLDASPFAEYYLRHPPGDEPTKVQERTSPGRIVGVGTSGGGPDDVPATRSLRGTSRDESVDSVLDATIDSLLDDEEDGGVASTP
jgi:energy-coupling factor transporter ATP-binding protein EcfA2